MLEYQLWQNAWKQDMSDPITISLPETWNVEFHEMKGDSKQPLSIEKIREKINTPLNMPSIREMAENGKEAVILFDDLSRGTPCRDIAHIILKELEAGGIGKGHVRFICALGTHGPLTRADFVMKLGEDIVENYPVFNHHAFSNCIQIGVSADGYPIGINREFWDCGVRIGIGMVAPHPYNGYGGGGKILFPGVAAYETAVEHHLKKGGTAPGNVETCKFRSGIEELAGYVNHFFKIDVVLNAKLDILELFAGDPIATYYNAAVCSAEANAMDPWQEEKDIVVVNANAKYNEAIVSIQVAEEELKEGGDIVLINFARTGQVVHYSSGPFGIHKGGPRWTPYEKRAKQKHRRVIYYTPYVEYAAKYQFHDPEKVIFAKNWDQVLTLLQEHGPDSRVSVLTDGSISYFRGQERAGFLTPQNSPYTADNICPWPQSAGHGCPAL